MGDWFLPGSSKQIEGIVIVSDDSGNMYAYLAVDTPPEIWRFEFDPVNGFSPCGPVPSSLSPVGVCVVILVAMLLGAGGVLAVIYYMQQRTERKRNITEPSAVPSAVPSFHFRALVENISSRVFKKSMSVRVPVMLVDNDELDAETNSLL